MIINSRNASLALICSSAFCLFVFVFGKSVVCFHNFSIGGFKFAFAFHFKKYLSSFYRMWPRLPMPFRVRRGQRDRGEFSLFSQEIDWHDTIT